VRIRPASGHEIIGRPQECDNSADIVSARNVISHLRALAQLTSDAQGAQRVAWGPVWRQARGWLDGIAAELGLRQEPDAAGNNWITLPGESPRTVIIGGHLDSVPNGGWLDGPLGVLAGIEALRVFRQRNRPVTLAVVDFADEEGARFSRSLLGSSGASGSLVPDSVRHLMDNAGVRLVDALHDNGVALDRMPEARQALMARHPRAYLELHIEQGPVLESMDRPTGVVIGAYGVERHVLRFTGQAAHSGSTPIAMRRDAFLAAAEAALAFREIARRYSTAEAGMVCTVGQVAVEPGIVTAVPGVCEIALDQRAIDIGILARALADAREAADHAARNNGVSIEWRHVWRIEPSRFDSRLVELCAEAAQEVTGHAPRLPSGPLHDAVEMSRLMPAVMMFAYSSRGLSHCKEEDTPEPYLEQSITAFLRLVEKTVALVSSE
jgi:N-carbamoyl-L-amino-acid hydrolase